MIRVLLTALMALAGPAAAQDAAPAYDPAILDACIARDGGLACIGEASSACMATSGGETTIGMGNCIHHEFGQWDRMLNDAYRQLTAEPGPGSDALRKAQRAWIAYVDASCAYEQGAMDGTIAGLVGASCRMSQTARRALDLRGYLADEAAR